MLKAVFIAFSVEKSTPAGKKYTTMVVAVVTNMRYVLMVECSSGEINSVNGEIDSVVTDVNIENAVKVNHENKIYDIHL